MIWRMNPFRLSKWRIEKMSESEVQGYVKKTWGSELWFANNEMYCGKLLTVFPEEWSSKGKFHYHKIKDETFFVVEGHLILDIGDDKTGEYQRIHLYENHSYRVMPGVKHRFKSGVKPYCKFVEASTTHSDDDSYRCYYDKEKEEWIDV